MAKNVGTLAILSENATLLSENCCSCKYFWYSRVYFVYLYLFYLFIYLFLTQKKQKRKVKTDTITHRTQINALDKITGTLNLIFCSTPFGTKITEIVSGYVCNHGSPSGEQDTASPRGRYGERPQRDSV